MNMSRHSGARGVMVSAAVAFAIGAMLRVNADAQTAGGNVSTQKIPDLTKPQLQARHDKCYRDSGYELDNRLAPDAQSRSNTIRDTGTPSGIAMLGMSEALETPSGRLRALQQKYGAGVLLGKDLMDSWLIVRENAEFLRDLAAYIDIEFLKNPPDPSDPAVISHRYVRCMAVAEVERVDAIRGVRSPAPPQSTLPAGVGRSSAGAPAAPPAPTTSAPPAGTPPVSAAELTKNLSAGYAALQQRSAAQAATGERKTHNLTLEASRCVSRLENESLSLFGGLRNTCAFDVNVAFCTVGSKPGSWSAAFECGSSGGLVTIHANQTATLHTKDAQDVNWAACQVPASPMDQEWKPGQGGIAHRCR